MAEQSSPGSQRGAPLRRLLPAQARHNSPMTSTAGPSRARPNPVVAACNTCRKQKAKCSGDRPTCRRCAQRRLTCEYVTRPGETRLQAISRDHNDMQGRASLYEEVVNLMKNLPEQDAQDIFRKLRSGADIGTVLNHAKAGDILVQMAVVPETRLRYDFPYRSEMPEMFSRNNPYLDSLIFEAASLYSPGQFPTQRQSTKFSSAEHQSLYVKPFHASQVMEPLLSDAKISWWTEVCDDDALMRDLLSVLFRCEYQFTAAFQKDLFLEDMVAHRTDFCSSLLVNITLAYSCVCYPRFSNRAEYWNPETLAYRFLAEAKRLWELEAAVPRITTIQAGILFSVFHNLCGLDEVGAPYRIYGVALAQRLRIFDDVVEGQSDRLRRGTAYAAWALYNWETLTAFSFMLSPLIKKPPSWPLPDPAQDIEWYGEIWVKYPLNHSLLPSYFGQIFRARSQFRIIMNEFCDAAFTEDKTLTLDKAYEYRKRLDQWYQDLPRPLQPRSIVLPGHLQIHIYYHHLLLTMFEPLVDAETSQEPTPREIVAEAKTCLQTLIRLYYLRHGYEAMDLFIVIPLMLTGYDCIDAINDQTPPDELEVLRSTLILIAQGLYNQRRNHYLAEALFRVIRGRMRPQEFALLKGTVRLDEEEEDRRRDMAQAVKSHWPVSVVKKQEEVDDHILTNLVENYAHLNLESEKESEQES